MPITINMPKAIEIAHSYRRTKRELEFAPYDKIVKLQIPGDNLTAAETARQTIRDRYAVIQTNIDACADVVALKQVLTDESII